jgi:hypothetical protein
VTTEDTPGGPERAVPQGTVATTWREGLRRHGQILLALVGLILLAGLVLLTQNRVVGFEPGYNELQPKHHGWVSSHTLAIIRHASWSNGFVGYAEAIVGDDGREDFGYFDRYPVFFSAAMHGLLSLKARLSTQVYLAKQAMNVVFLLTVFLAFVLVRKITGQTLAALAVAIASVSSPYLLFYKDMVHYDQPALLGVFLLLVAIAYFKIDGQWRWLYPAVLVSVGLGRGYASFAVLGTWLLLETLPLTRLRAAGWQRFVRLIALRALILGVVWGALCLSYNIAVESLRREVPVAQTSIVLSAQNRLALNEDFNESYLHILNWRTFIEDQVIRIVRWSFPVWEYEVSAAWSALLVGGLFAVIFLLARRLDQTGVSCCLTALAGPGSSSACETYRPSTTTPPCTTSGSPWPLRSSDHACAGQAGSGWHWSSSASACSPFATIRSRDCTDETGSHSTATHMISCASPMRCPAPGSASSSRTGFLSPRTPWGSTCPMISWRRRPSPIT